MRVRKIETKVLTYFQGFFVHFEIMFYDNWCSVVTYIDIINDLQVFYQILFFVVVILHKKPYILPQYFKTLIKLLK